MIIEVSQKRYRSVLYLFRMVPTLVEEVQLVTKPHFFLLRFRWLRTPWDFLKERNAQEPENAVGALIEVESLWRPRGDNPLGVFRGDFLQRDSF